MNQQVKIRNKVKADSLTLNQKLKGQKPTSALSLTKLALKTKLQAGTPAREAKAK